MTIKEIYNRAVELKVENTPIMISVNCSDDYYSIEAELLKNNEVEITNKGIVFSINN